MGCAEQFMVAWGDVVAGKAPFTGEMSPRRVQVEQGIAALNHNGPAMKSVHRLWRVKNRVYFAESPTGFAYWDRFDESLKKLGAPPEGSCSHR